MPIDAFDLDLPPGSVPPLDLNDGSAAPDETEPPEKEGARLPLNDTGNGRRLALYCGSDALFVPRVGWHIWDGRRWKLDPDGIAVRRLAQTIQTRIVGEIAHVTLDDWQLQALASEPTLRARHGELQALPVERRTSEQQAELEDLTRRLAAVKKIHDRKSNLKAEHRTFAKTTGNKGRIDAMLVEATTSLSRDLEDLDADALTVNCESGVLRFHVEGGGDTGFSRVADFTLVPHAREIAVAGRDAPQILTKLMPVEFDSTATCPTFDAFLERVQPEREMRAFLQRWFGLSMTAVPVQKFLFMYGHGANGKSVLADIMARMMGEYATSVKIESLTGRNRRGGGDATPDLMPLVGARFARAAEPEEGERLQEGMIKDLTGGEPIMVRQLHSDFITVRPFFKLTISGNHKPDIRGTDDGIWRRVMLALFGVQIPPEERDEGLVEKLWLERAGIFNWLITGLIDVLEGGLQEPEQVVAMTSEYRSDSDPLGTFLADACVISGAPGAFLTSRELIDGFNLWLDLRGDSMWGARTVSLKIKALAGRFRDATTGKSFEPGKRVVAGYFGIEFTGAFRAAFDAAPRDHKGRPYAQGRSDGSHDDD